MKIKALVITIFCLAITMLPPKAMADDKVIRVTDGDTFILSDGSRVRLDGIDAPETDQPYGAEAKAELEKLILNRIIDIRCDGTSYNRKVCQISCDDIDIQREMVKRGYAFDYTHYSDGYYKSAEIFAQKFGRGVWAQPNGGVRPWAYRHRKKQ